MQINQNWATACEIRAAADVFNRKIDVIMQGRSERSVTNTKSSFISPPNETETINTVIFLENNHFRLLRLINHAYFCQASPVPNKAHGNTHVSVHMTDHSHHRSNPSEFSTNIDDDDKCQHTYIRSHG